MTDFSDQLINNSSYLNPGVDRSQFLLELYTNEVEFQFAKMKVCNIFLSTQIFPYIV